MVLYAPPLLAQGAVRKPLPFGLFSVINFNQGVDDDVHWQGGGATWEFLDPDGAEVLAVGGPNNVDGSPAFGVPKDLSSVDQTWMGTATPFSVYGTFKVSPVAYNPELANFRALQVLTSFEEKQAENQFWTGAAGNEPNLTDGVTDLGARTLQDSIGVLEDFIASTYGSLGAIHMSRKNATDLANTQILDSSGSVLKTRLGTPVVAGAGYPDDKVKGTPALFGMRSEVFFSNTPTNPVLDTTNNDLYALAERSYLIGFDPTGVGSVTLS
jgi:hypothetical protein